MADFSGLYADAQPDALALNEKLATIMSTIPMYKDTEPSKVREERENGHGPFGKLVLDSKAEYTDISGVQCRIFKPETEIRGIYLNIHGGGWTFGRPHHYDEPLRHLCEGTSLCVVSVDYRLAPEHPYPTPVDDCEAVALWLLANGSAQFCGGRPLPMIIGGDSAGAHLSTLVLLRLKAKRGTDTGFSGVNLQYGMYNLAEFTPSVRHWGSIRTPLCSETISYFASNFCPDVAARFNPDVSPLLAKDLSGLPPALFVCGTADPLLDDTGFMHWRWITARNKADLHLYPGGCHAFDRHPTQIQKDFRATLNQWLNKIIDENTPK